MSEPPSTRTRWAGGVVLAALTLLVLGAIQAFVAFVAFFNSSYLYVPSSALAVRLDYSAWGWLQLLMGVLMVAAGYGLLAGKTWARVVAVVLACLSAIANMTFIAAYPWWAVTIIVLDVVVIYAVTVHGAEAQVVLRRSPQGALRTRRRRSSVPHDAPAEPPRRAWEVPACTGVARAIRADRRTTWRLVMSDGRTTPAGSSAGPQHAAGNPAGGDPRVTTGPVGEATPGGAGPITGPASTGTGPITEPTGTGWVGWVYFAGIMLMLLGAFQIIEALTALFNRHYLLVSSKGLLVHADLAAWGWLHLVLGVVAVVAGYGVMVGQRWAQIVGIVLAGVSAIVNLAYIAAYPLWSVIVIALDVIIIHALAVHGREVRRP